MKCSILFSRKRKKYLINLSSVEFANRVVKVNVFLYVDGGENIVVIILRDKLRLS